MALKENYWSSIIIKEDKLGGEFCYVSKSPFIIGRDKQIIETHADYCIGKYPVTKSEFLEFVYESGYDYDSYSIDVMNGLSPDSNSPASFVSWWDAKHFARWKRKKTGEYYSLPSELEWEAAARGIAGSKYPWGENEPNFTHAHFSSEIPNIKTIPVGSKPMNQSSCGCIDMVGNVWEWCLDKYDESEDEAYVLRGGSCVENEDCCACTSKRFCCDPNYRVPYAGFRLMYLTKEMYNVYKMISSSGQGMKDTSSRTMSRTIIM